jgi:hypothetical protein
MHCCLLDLGEDHHLAKAKLRLIQRAVDRTGMICRKMDQVGDTMVHDEGSNKTENCLHATVSTTTGL